MQQYNQGRIRYIHEIQAFLAALSQIDGLRVYPSLANFALVKLVNGCSAFDFFSYLLIEYGIYTRSCADKKGLSGEFVRIAARTPVENARILCGIPDLFPPVQQTGPVGVATNGVSH
jgi:histidinol-phosphate/aromatic aminotransferase/cobyric acid decarboxylase-like protein